MKNIMKAVLCGALFGTLGGGGAVAFGQVYTPGGAPTYLPVPSYSAPQPDTSTLPASVPTLADNQLDQMLAPIALYPDPLLADILPAMTYPDDVAAAAVFVQTYPNATEAQIQAQPWPAPVQALAHYPTVVQYLANNMEWTQTLGAAFVNQQGDVINAIQRLRAEAQAAGSLATTPQQQVIVDSGTIEILPVQPNVVYVPVYDPAVVYVRGAHREPIRFGAALRIGGWLDLNFDWSHHAIGSGFHWDRPGDWRAPHPDLHQWARDAHRPPPRMPAPAVRAYQRDVHRGYVAPAPVRPVFGGRETKADVQREVQRARVSRPNFDHAAPHAAPRGPVIVPGRGAPAGRGPGSHGDDGRGGRGQDGRR